MLANEITEKKFNYFYKITNNINGKYYYGIRSTNTLHDWYLGSGYNIIKAVKKYGSKNFTKENIIFFPTRKQASDFEAQMVTLEVIQDPLCYNLRTGGDNGYFKISKPWSEEAKQRKREKYEAWKGTEGWFAWKKKIGEASAKRPRPPMSVEQKEKLSIALTGRKISDVTREKLRIAHTGKKVSPEIKLKIKQHWIDRPDVRPESGKKAWQTRIKNGSSLNTESKKGIHGKKCNVENIDYISITDVTKYYNIGHRTVVRRINSSAIKWSNWNYV